MKKLFLFSLSFFLFSSFFLSSSSIVSAAAPSCTNGQQITISQGTFGNTANCTCDGGRQNIGGKCTDTSGVGAGSGLKGITNPAIDKTLGGDADAANNGKTFAFYFVYVWRALIFIGGIMVLIYFLWGAIDWIAAQGEAGKVQKARDKITGSLMGFLVLLGSFVIIEFIGKIFKIDLLNPELPTINESTSIDPKTRFSSTTV
jgi:hypothetical protein